MLMCTLACHNAAYSCVLHALGVLCSIFVFCYFLSFLVLSLPCYCAQQLQWCEQYGVDRSLIRVWCGLEEKDSILDSFGSALDKVAAASR